MKTISYWGKNNPIKARIIIVLSHLALLFSGIYLGTISYTHDFHLPYEIIPLLVSVFFVAYILYPEKGQKTGWWKHNYTRQKTMDGLLIISSFLILILGVNRFAYEPMPHNIAKAQLIVYKVNPDQSVAKPSIWKTVKSIKKKLKNDLRELKSKVKRDQGKKIKLHQILLMCLTILLVSFLIYLSLLLSCNLSCSGQNTLAIVVLIGGITASIGLSMVLIKHINKGRKSVS